MPIPEPDVWGLAFRQAYEGKLKSVILRRDDGLAEDVPDMIASYFGPPEEQQLEVLRELSGRVLDVGCGVGRHLLWLQEHGVEVVGIDHSPGAVEVARARGCREVYLGTVADLDFPADYFDAAIMFGNNAGIGGNIEGCRAMFRRLARWVRPGGRLITEGRNLLEADYPGNLDYYEANRRAGRPPGQMRWRLELDGVVGEWFCLMLFDPETLEGLLGESGWRVLDRRTYDGGLFVVVAEPAR
jgi:SAM-dependent methyltransferase